ncbi:MAG: HD-GYP domain-containing protein [Candidatus Krumholzibacteriia bacterium]
MEQRFSDLIILLASGINQRRMYFDDHPKVRAFASDFSLQLARLLGETGELEFSFGVYNGKFIRNGKYLVGPSIAGRSLIAFAERLGCGGFAFRLPTEPPDAAAFFNLGATVKDKVGTLDDARRLFDLRGVGHISLLPPYGEDKGKPEDQPAELLENEEDLGDDFSPLMAVYQSLYEIVSRNNELSRRGHDVDIQDARSFGETLTRSTGDVLDVMQFIRYPDYDSYTIGHSVRVAALATVVGRKLGLGEELIGELSTAGLLHDLGKGRVPESILFKPAKLDPQERAIIESHPALGAQILISSGDASELMVSAAWGHHLRADGGGYPRVPGWHRPSFAASIIHVCDVFEALTAMRPYKRSMSPLAAYEVMFRDRGSFDPRPLSALVHGLGLFPPGSEVVLSDGRRAVVSLKGHDLDRPRVRITHERSGRALDPASRPLIDLAGEPGLEVVDIVLIGATA